MSCLRRSARLGLVLKKVPDRRHTVKAGSQFESRFRRNLTTHGAAAGAGTTGETRPVTKVEKIILDTIKVGQFPALKCSLE